MKKSIAKINGIINLLCVAIVLIVDIIFINIFDKKILQNRNTLHLFGEIGVFFVVFLIPSLIILTIITLFKHKKVEQKYKILNYMALILDFCVCLFTIAVYSYSFWLFKNKFSVRKRIKIKMFFYADRE